jgi:hypothetical protein
MAGYVGVSQPLDPYYMKKLGLEILSPVERSIGYSASETTGEELRTVEVALPISREDGIGILLTRWESQFSPPRPEELSGDDIGTAQGWVHYGASSPSGLGLNSSRILGTRDERVNSTHQGSSGVSTMFFSEYAQLPLGMVVVASSIYVSSRGNSGWIASGSVLTHIGRLWYYPIKLDTGAFVNAFAISSMS